MKRFFLYLIILTGLSSIFTACKKGDNNISFSSTPDMTASINESAFQQSTLISYVDKSSGTKLIIKALEATSNRTIYLQITNYAGLTGTYNIDANGTVAQAYYQIGSVINYGTTGSIILYNITPGLIQGTFSFSMKDVSKTSDIQVTGMFTVAPLQ